MTERAWQDLIVGDRMAVDQEFAQQVTDSQFSRQEWGLIMTAVEFTIRTETEMDDEQADEVVARANELCKVHDALKSELKASITVESGAF